MTRQARTSAGGDDAHPVGRELLDALREGVLIFDREGRLSSHNEAARRILGRRARELDGWPMSELCRAIRDADGRPLPSGETPPEIARRESRAVDGVFGLEPFAGRRLTVRIGARPIEEAGAPPHALLVSLADITRERVAEAARVRIERRWRTAFEGAPIGMALVRLDGLVAEVNDELCRLVGREPHEIKGGTWLDIVHPEDLERSRRSRARLTGGQTDREQVETRVVRPDGSIVWCEVTSALVSADPPDAHLVAHIADITERRRVELELEHLALHDPLTGLLNRRGFEQELTAHLERVRRYGGGGAVMLLDLDRFKRINDTLGHHAGDVVLAATARCLRSRLRRTDVLARLGGDEFAILLPGVGTEEVANVGRELLGAVSAEVQIPDGRGPLTASAGAALVGDGEAGEEDMMVAADLAMYDAKGAGRDRFMLAGAHEPAARAESRRSWIDRVEHALDHDGLVLFAQPVRTLGSGEVAQYELLVRMRGPDGVLFAPDAFLDAAERFGLVQRIDAWVVDQAVEILRRSGAAGPSLEVNVSGRSIAGDDLVARIAERVGQSGVAPGRLVLEIAERAAVTNLVQARRFSERLAELGCRFALDDFGAGFGSLQYVKHLPCDFIKIDGEFVRGCADSAADRVIIDSLVALAHGLGKEAIAECVSDAATLGVVERHGVDFAQGYHVGMPEPADRLVR